MVNLSRYLGFGASEVLTRTNNKFEKRFRYIEERCNIRESNIEEMERLWKESKKLEGDSNENR